MKNKPIVKNIKRGLHQHLDAIEREECSDYRAFIHHYECADRLNNLLLEFMKCGK